MPFNFVIVIVKIVRGDVRRSPQRKGSIVVTKHSSGTNVNYLLFDGTTSILLFDLRVDKVKHDEISGWSSQASNKVMQVYRVISSKMKLKE
ncbi:hypothetical protein BV898_03123 [Hypsibius exemplaris]|uniref:Uncharacterized protein n=1 Tax=Hypsibius exemplaris TaxID=2072580 RepID=A0A1W0X651_HYPEX|nr:hypothetical protein BV898_03123 [Hypsibius exemplaris]